MKRKPSDPRETLRAASGLPFALCWDCAALYAQSFRLKQVSADAGRKITCEACRRKTFGAEFVEEKKL